MITLSDLVNVKKTIFLYWDDESYLTDRLHPINFVLKAHREILSTDYTIEFINKNIVKEFLIKHNYNFLYSMFDRFNIYSTRSNIARLVYLYLYGGFYCDTHVRFFGDPHLVQICENTNDLNKHSMSFMASGSNDCSKTKPTLGFLYSNGDDTLFLECLNLIQSKIQDIIISNKHKAGLYTKDIHVACGNGLYGYITKEGKSVNPEINKATLFNYFRHIKPFGGDPKLFACYGLKMMMGEGVVNTRAGNKHWSELCKELDLFN